MSIGLVFWILMLFWLVFNAPFPNAPWAGWGSWPGYVLLFILFLLLGWAAFGPPIRG